MPASASHGFVAGEGHDAAVPIDEPQLRLGHLRQRGLVSARPGGRRGSGRARGRAPVRPPSASCPSRGPPSCAGTRVSDTTRTGGAAASPRTAVKLENPVGWQLYSYMAQRYSSERNASLHFKGLGIPGMVMPSNADRLAKVNAVNFLIWDETLLNENGVGDSFEKMK